MALKDKAARAAYNREYQRRIRHGKKREETLAKQREVNARYRAAHPTKAAMQGQILREPRSLAATAAALRWDGLRLEKLRESDREAFVDSRDAELARLAEIW